MSFTSCNRRVTYFKKQHIEEKLILSYIVLGLLAAVRRLVYVEELGAILYTRPHHKQLR